MSACLFRFPVHSTYLCMACCCSSSSHSSGLIVTTDIHLSIPGLVKVALCMAANQSTPSTLRQSHTCLSASDTHCDSRLLWKMSMQQSMCFSASHCKLSHDRRL